MDFFKSAMGQYQEYQASQQSHRQEEDDEHHEDVKKALSSDIRPAGESDVHEAKSAHDKVYKEGAETSDEELGKAAGVQAFSEYEQAERSGEESGGQGKLVQMAMAEAMKLFSGKGGAASGSDKSAVVQSAIAMAMKLFAGKSGEGGGASAVSSLLAMVQGGGGKGGEGGTNPLMGMLSQASENPQVANMLKKFM
ncbi:hypothetical protein CPC16_002729 [Podila verticillata]|nr:hypothetical protein CPC16_002729 [Podila verticillata]